MQWKKLVKLEGKFVVGTKEIAGFVGDLKALLLTRVESSLEQLDFHSFRLKALRRKPSSKLSSFKSFFSTSSFENVFKIEIISDWTHFLETGTSCCFEQGNLRLFRKLTTKLYFPQAACKKRKPFCLEKFVVFCGYA